MRSPNLHPKLWYVLREVLGNQGQDVFEMLVHDAVSEDILTKTRSIEVLAFVEGVAARNWLFDQIKSDDPITRLAAGWALLTKGQDSGALLLRELLRSSNPHLAVAAACRMASVGMENGLFHLLQHYFNDEHRDIVHWTVAMMPPEHHMLVLAFKQSRSIPVRCAVCDLAGVFLLEGQELWLKDLLQQPDMGLRMIAAIALMRREDPLGHAAFLELYEQASTPEPTNSSVWRQSYGSLYPRRSLRILHNIG